MMQPSNLDEKILSLSSSHPKKQNRPPSHTVNNHLKTVSTSTKNPIHNSENSKPDLSAHTKQCTSEKSKTDVPIQY